MCFICKIQDGLIIYAYLLKAFAYFRILPPNLQFSIMNYWLVKSEPEVFSFDRLLSEGNTVWDGVRNYAARLHLRAMKKGDLVLFYHSNVGKEIVGIAKVAKEHYQDPTAGEEDWSAIDLIPFKKLKKPVTLTQIKSTKQLMNIALVTIGRLSVMPIKADEYKTILDLGS